MRRRRRRRARRVLLAETVGMVEMEMTAEAEVTVGMEGMEEMEMTDRQDHLADHQEDLLVHNPHQAATNHHLQEAVAGLGKGCARLIRITIQVEGHHHRLHTQCRCPLV